MVFITRGHHGIMDITDLTIEAIVMDISIILIEIIDTEEEPLTTIPTEEVMLQLLEEQLQAEEIQQQDVLQTPQEEIQEQLIVTLE